MYGKSFESMFEGSMVGAGINVFAVWGYIITKCRRGFIEINPKLLAFTLGGTEEEVLTALEYLQKPDPESRSKEEEGRRLVKDGQFQYRIVNWERYDQIKNAMDRRDYLREKQAEFRARQKISTAKTSSGVNDDQSQSIPKPPAVPPDGQKQLEKPEKYHKDARSVLHYLNEKAGKRQRETDSNLSMITARLREAEITFEGVKQLIDRQCERWIGTDQAEYLRVETLFNKTKFDSYWTNREMPAVAPQVTNGAATPGQTGAWHIQKAIDVKEGQAKELFDRHALETGLDTTWNSPAARLEYQKIRGEIKTLKEKMVKLIPV